MFIIRAWSFWLSILYQFGLLLYCRYFDVKIELDTCVGSWLYFYDILLGYCGVFWAILCCFRESNGHCFCPLFVSYYVNSIQIWKFLFVGHYAGEIFVKSLLPYLLIICEAMKFLALLQAYSI